MAQEKVVSTKKRKGVSYAKWGYIFIAPFFIVYCIFSLLPLLQTIYLSFFENYFRLGITEVGPNFIGIDNYKTVFELDFLKYLKNTVILWLLGFVPQIIISLLFAAWFTDLRLRLKATGLFKTVIYLPNILMASSLAVLFYTLFSDRGPINDILAHLTNNSNYFFNQSTTIFSFTTTAAGNRGLIGLVNFLMWYGNTTIILMAGIMGVDPSLYEAGNIDGASGPQMFRMITIPLIKPILLYTLVTSMIGGLQMYDVPQLLTNGAGNPNRTSYTLIMWLNDNLVSRNYGLAGAISVVLFIVSAVLSLLVFRLLTGDRYAAKQKRLQRKNRKRGEQA